MDQQQEGDNGSLIELTAPEPEAQDVLLPLVSMESWSATSTMASNLVLARAASSSTQTASSSGSTCAADNNTPICAKPADAQPLTLPIALGVSIPIVGALCAFIYFHRRHLRKQRLEDANDRHASLDFGLDNVPRKSKKAGRALPEMTITDMDLREKPGRRTRGLSMDMSSPYLLPPELQNSRESLHSLSRNLPNDQDPYRPVSQYYPQDGASTRSFNKPRGEGSSIYTGSSGAPSRLLDNPTADLLSNASRMSRSRPPAGFIPPPRQNSLPPSSASLSPVDNQQNLLPRLSFAAGSVSPVEPAYLPPSNQGIVRQGLPNGLHQGPSEGLAPMARSGEDSRDSYMGHEVAAIRLSNNYLGAYIHGTDVSSSPPPPPSKSSEPPLSQTGAPFGHDPVIFDPMMHNPIPQQTIARESPPIANSLPANPRPQRKQSLPPVDQPFHHEEPQQTWIEDESEYGDGFKVTPPSPGRENHAEHMREHRYSMDVPPEESANAGLGAPGFNPRRLSMGLRPLPPNAAVESDDPEVRAMRIRSFYKEYFDESRPAPKGQYYEDYDPKYYGEAAPYYDPNANNFVMPYAQPVTRRAMTPPPGGARFMGQGPPRAFHGSMGNLRGPMPQINRPFSSASNQRGSPGPARRPMPPPAPLNSLPTPSKLKDDSFAIFNAADFAPPSSYKDRAAGRSQSPLGERRPYSPSVPAYKPLASSFDELAPMPSPHLLRKSGTFTALDFAPPRRIRGDGDTGSDSGSIRSNRSGVSAMQSAAIRNGAYRVSRLPGDMIFSRDDMKTVLKPTWGQRQGI